MKLIRLLTFVVSLMMVNLFLIPSGVLLASSNYAPSVFAVYLVDNVDSLRNLHNGSPIPTKSAKLKISLSNVDLSSVNNQTVALYNNEGNPIEGITFQGENPKIGRAHV